jgi:hypothetical protein
MENRMYLLTIRLYGIELDIWRRFVVPGDITLDRLHDVIQIVMGWQDYHLHTFTIGKKRYTENPESKEDGAREDRYRLVDLIKQKGRTFAYEYDFGDDWRHTITIEDSRYSNPGLQAPLACLDGAGACPPEDVGGVPGYHEFLKALKDPRHAEHENYKEWISGHPCYHGNYDSERFDIDAVNDELLKYLRWSRYRTQFWHSGW